MNIKHKLGLFLIPVILGPSLKTIISCRDYNAENEIYYRKEADCQTVDSLDKKLYKGFHMKGPFVFLPRLDVDLDDNVQETNVIIEMIHTYDHSDFHHLSEVPLNFNKIEEEINHITEDTLIRIHRLFLQLKLRSEDEEQDDDLLDGKNKGLKNDKNRLFLWI